MKPSGRVPGGFTVSEQTAEALHQSLHSSSVEIAALNDPASPVWWQSPREDLPEGWDKTQIEIWETMQEQLRQAWLQYKDLMATRNVPSTPDEMSAFLLESVYYHV